MKLFTVDAFADSPFCGNPAAVCLLDCDKDDAWHQHLACEMNLSETAFVRPTAGRTLLDCDGEYDLRWFTPGYEVDLCGHATLATAHTLWKELGESNSTLKFNTLSGVLKATKAGDLVELNFPSTPANPDTPVDGLLESLGLEEKDVQFSGKSTFDAVLQVKSENDVLNLTPDFGKLGEIDVRGTIVTAVAGEVSKQRAGRQVDFVSRFFAPTAGINEDPVTGSAHCCLAPFWLSQLPSRDENRLLGFQASRRGGVVEVELHEDRVLLRGRGITMLTAELSA